MPAIAAAKMLRRTFEHEHALIRLRGSYRGAQRGVAPAQYQDVVRP
jgi:hypothetical protein